MSFQGEITDVLNELDELIAEVSKKDELTDEESKELVDLEQQIHEKLAVVFDKFEIVVGDERAD
jgi:polyhydroxyalkanoate synthesis regulator phasin